MLNLSSLLTHSAVTHAQINFPQYFDPIQEYGDEKCISDLQMAVGVIDALLDLPSPVPDLVKGLFGLSGLEDDDFADVIGSPFGGFRHALAVDPHRLLAGSELGPQGRL